MILQRRINILSRLGDYMQSDDSSWKLAKEKASHENGWFIPEFIEIAAKNIAENFLNKESLEKWVSNYYIPSTRSPKNVGIVMAGNVPLVGFHDLLSVFISGHQTIMKPSSKDDALIKHLVDTLENWDPEISDLVRSSEMLRNCDAYIATGSNNTSRYFEYYFSRYPHIIRRNKTSVGLLTGDETKADLEKLADDVFQFFGLGCRNVTKIYVPADYDFRPMLSAFEKYNYLADHNKYKNNYDYNLTIHILNKKFYMTNGCLLLIEDAADFSPISQLNYEYYANKDLILSSLNDSPEIQCIVGFGGIAFGQAQSPRLSDYADDVDTMAFLQSL